MIKRSSFAGILLVAILATTIMAGERKGHPKRYAKANNIKLKAVQNSKQRIIYEKDKDVTFSVTPALPTGTEYRWDLDGQGTFNTDPYEPTNLTTTSFAVQYISGANAVGKIKVEETVANRRKTFVARVKIKVPDGNGGFYKEFTKKVTVRVALNSYQGTPFPANIGAPGIDTDAKVILANNYLKGRYKWSNTNPVAFTAVEPEEEGFWKVFYQYLFNLQAGNRLQVTRRQIDGAAQTLFIEKKKRRVLALVILKRGATGAFSINQEALDIFVAHEAEHCRQFICILTDKAGNKTVWGIARRKLPWKLVAHLLMEIPAYRISVTHSKASWRFLLTNQQLFHFTTKYKKTKKGIKNSPRMNVLLRTKIISLLRDEYTKMIAVFPEMGITGINGYDYSIEKP